METENKWQKLKYWQKGSLIGLITTSIPIFLISIWLDYGPSGREIEVAFYLLFAGMFIVFIIPATIAGGVIGLLIKMYKKK